MKNIIKKILKEETDNHDYSWVDEYVYVPEHLLNKPLVKVISPWYYYPTYYDMAIRLGIPLKCKNRGGMYDMHEYCHNYFEPEKGDMCVLVNELEDNGITYYRLYRISDGKETVIGRRGFEFLD